MKEFGYGIAGLTLLVLLYVGSYYAMVTPDRTAFALDGTPKPEYRFGGATADVLYYPAFNADRQIRPARWLESHPFELIPLLKRVGPNP